MPAGSITFDGDWLVEFGRSPYFELIRADAKVLRRTVGGRWSPDEKVWRFPETAAPHMARLADRYNLATSDELDDYTGKQVTEGVVDAWTETIPDGRKIYALHVEDRRFLAAHRILRNASKVDDAVGYRGHGVAYRFVKGAAVHAAVAALKALPGVDLRRLDDRHIDYLEARRYGLVGPIIQVVLDDQHFASLVPSAGDALTSVTFLPVPHHGTSTKWTMPLWALRSCLDVLEDGNWWTDISDDVAAERAEPDPTATYVLPSTGDTVGAWKLNDDGHWQITRYVRGDAWRLYADTTGPLLIHPDVDIADRDEPDEEGRVRLRLKNLRIELADAIGTGPGAEKKDLARPRVHYDNQWIITMPRAPHPAAWEALRTIDGARQAKLDWYLPADYPASLFVDSLAPALGDVDATKEAVTELDAATDLEEWRRERAPTLRPLAKATTCDPVDDIPDGTSLYQQVAVRHIVASGGTLLADLPGLGKSLEALAAVAHADAWPAVVVCPAGARNVWSDELAKWLPGRTAHIVQGTKPYPLPPADLYVCGYPTIHEWVEPLAGLRPQAVIADEAHRVKNPSARQTKATLALFAGAADAPVRIAATGTPLRNKPADLWPLLAMLGHYRLAGGSGAAAFGKRWAKRTAELHDILADTCLVRRRKEDVLDQLPEKRIAEIVLDSAGWREYWASHENLAEWTADHSDALTNQDRIKAEGMLVELRHRLGLAKVREAVEWVTDWRAEAEPGQRLVVWCWHRDVAETLRDRLNASLIYGGVSDAKRREQIACWADPEGSTDVLVGSIGAMGEAVTLHLDGRASDALFVELPWVPGELEQCIDREHRRGQPNAVTAYLLLGAGTLDAAIYRLLVAKAAIADAVIDGAHVQFDPVRTSEILAALYPPDGDEEDQETKSVGSPNSVA